MYLFQFLKSSRYDYYHIHLNELSWIVVFYLNSIGKKNIFIHSHNFFSSKHSSFKSIIHRTLLRTFLKKNYCLISCSNEAGDWLFGKREFILLKNSFDLEKFSYKGVSKKPNEKVRVGFLGRLEDQKDPLAAVDLYLNLFAGNSLTIKGEGSLLSKLKLYCIEKEIDHEVFFKKPDDMVVNFFNNIDVLIAPSKHEGLGIVIVEAYASGCEIIISEAFPKEIKNLKNINIIPYYTPNSHWSRNEQSRENIRHLKALGYCNHEKTLEKIYKNYHSNNL